MIDASIRERRASLQLPVYERHMVKRWMPVVLVVLVACSSKSGSKAGAGSGSAAVAKGSGLTRVPKVAVAATIVADPPKPPPLVILLDEKGALFANRVASWEALATKDPMVGAYPTDLKRAYPRLAEGRAMGLPPDLIYESLKPPGPGDIDLDLLEDTSTREGLAQDDPPPPEEEDMPDDGEDESGGTGTAIALDEGKMGKKDSDRAEGQYKMRKNQDDPQLAAMQKAEQERALARRGLHKAAGSRAATMERPRADKPMPQTTAVGEVIKDGKLETPAYSLLLAAPTAKATDFIDTIAATRPWIAVAHDGKVRPLRIETIPERDYAPEPKRWIELRVGATDLVFEAVPDVAVPLTGALDQVAFAAALEKARDSRDLDPLTRVDVLVEPSVDVQRTIDVLVALDQAGVVMIGLGRAPEAGTDQAKLRGVRRTEVTAAGFNAQGDLDKALIRTTVLAKIDLLRRCFDSARAKTPGLAGGTLQTQFFITPNGKVASASAAGIDPEVATCVAAAIKSFEFPKPKGGGGVQVNYPFTFDP